MVFDYCLLPMFDFNITCLKIFFFSLIFSFFLFCSFAPACICFSFSFLFFLIFSFFFFCVCIFSNFSVLSFNSHKLFFLKLSIRIIKPKRIHFGIKLYLSICCIPLSFVSTCISFFFFFAYLFLLCVDIFKIFSQTQTLFKDLNLRSLSLCFKFNYFCLLAKQKIQLFLFEILKKKIVILRVEFFFFLFFKVTQHTSLI